MYEQWKQKLLSMEFLIKMMDTSFNNNKMMNKKTAIPIS